MDVLRTASRRWTRSLGLLAISSLVAGALPAGCGSEDDEGVRYVDEPRVVAEGETCGEWQVEPPGSNVITRVSSTCASGTTCRYHAQVNPPKELTESYGICVRRLTVDCANDPDPCPDRWACEVGFNVPPPGRCSKECKKSLDCPGPYQVCRTNVCTNERCRTPEETDGSTVQDCPLDATCERGVCVAKVE